MRASFELDASGWSNVRFYPISDRSTDDLKSSLSAKFDQPHTILHTGKHGAMISLCTSVVNNNYSPRRTKALQIRNADLIDLELTQNQFGICIGICIEEL